MISAKRFPVSNSIFQKCRTNKMTILYCCVFYVETNQLPCTLSNIFIKNKGIIKIICATILRQINLKGYILLLRIFFLTCLCSCGLLIGLYSFCSLSYLCKGLQLFYFFLSVPFLYSQLFLFLFSCVCSGGFYIIHVSVRDKFT